MSEKAYRVSRMRGKRKTTLPSPISLPVRRPLPQTARSQRPPHLRRNTLLAVFLITAPTLHCLPSARQRPCRQHPIHRLPSPYIPASRPVSRYTYLTNSVPPHVPARLRLHPYSTAAHGKTPPFICTAYLHGGLSPFPEKVVTLPTIRDNHPERN